MSVDLYYSAPKDHGWEPIRRMVDLLGGYLGTEPTHLNVHLSQYKIVKAQALVPRFPWAGRTGIVVASDPGTINAIFQKPVMTRRYKRLIGWVIDSFWHDRIPYVARNQRIFDHIFLTDPEDARAWASRGVPSVATLPWGSDVWGHLNQGGGPRDVDVLRMGREPVAYDDDDVTRHSAEADGLSFHGSPPLGETSESSGDFTQHWLGRSRSLLAFQNLVSPARYTHPTRSYLTARWADGLGHGCVVAGARPLSEAAEQLLWPEATLELDPQDLESGMATLARHLDQWTEEDAKRQQNQALASLDWRHRFADLLKAAGVRSAALDRDLRDIKTYLQDESTLFPEGVQ